jgi:Lon protease-like protein
MADEIQYIPEVIPLFPLPEVVLFPRTIVPLHVFEPRYREMMADAVAGQGCFAIALLKPGYQPLYYTRRAPIHAIVGVGRILESEKVEDGNYNLLLRGVGRARIVNEIGTHAYRLARVEPVETYCHHDAARARKLSHELFRSIRGNRGIPPELRQHWLRLADLDLELDELADLLAAGAPVEAELRQCLLDEPDAFERATLLVQQLHTLAAVARVQLHVPARDEYNLN